MLGLAYASGWGSTATNGGLTITPAPGRGPITILPWICTARSNATTSAGESGNVFNETARTSTTCYMRGLAENIEIQTSSAAHWQWRRICFTYKDPVQVGAALNFFSPTAKGMQRMLYNVTSNKSEDNAALGQMISTIFRGVEGNDWNNYMTAPLDEKRITVKYDKTTHIASGNDSGVVRKYKRWHPMNKNLVYDDYENGGTRRSDYYSVASKAGMGDYYVIDMFLAGLGSTSTDLLNFNPVATLYWHEK